MEFGNLKKYIEHYNINSYLWDSVNQSAYSKTLQNFGTNYSYYINCKLSYKSLRALAFIIRLYNKIKARYWQVTKIIEK